jgi:hypothetical protein
MPSRRLIYVRWSNAWTAAGMYIAMFGSRGLEIRSAAIEWGHWVSVDLVGEGDAEGFGVAVVTLTQQNDLVLNVVRFACRESAIDNQVGPGDPPRFIRRKEQHGHRNIVRLSKSTQWMHANQPIMPDAII